MTDCSPSQKTGECSQRQIKKYLHEKEIYFPKEHRFIVLLLQHGRCEHTLKLI